jgi:hypothetical protein
MENDPVLKEHIRQRHHDNYTRQRKGEKSNYHKEMQDALKIKCQIVTKLVDEYPLNLDYAFEIAALKLKTTKESIKTTWYNYIRYGSLHVTCGSVRRFSYNRKNLERNKYGNLPEYNSIPCNRISEILENLIKFDK